MHVAGEPTQIKSTTKGTRRKRQRAAKPWFGLAENDENSPIVANMTPATAAPTTGKKARFSDYLNSDMARSTVKREPFSKSTIKKDILKSTIKKEIPRFIVVCCL